MSPPERPALRHVPALDGIRGAGVAGILVFHAGYLDGGWLGVDLFFVLSGFLITSLLVTEFAGTGTISLGAFWARRARRLLPALFAALIGVAAYTWLFASANEHASIRADALSTLFYVANWHSIFAEYDYWALFSGGSPLEHTWSLAIEEQFYLLWPPACLLLLRRFGGSSRALAICAGALALASALWMALLFDELEGTARVYFGSDTRACAVLLGAALASAVHRRGVVSESRKRLIDAIGLAALAGLGWAWATVGGESPWVYRGGMLLFGLLATCVIAAAVLADRGRVARLFAFAPLRWLGLVSYGLYLWHWPLYLVLSPMRTDLDGIPLAGLRIAVSLAFAVVSYRALEVPIRRGSFSGRSLAVSAAGAFVATTAVLLVVTMPPATDESQAGSPQAATGSRDRPRVLVIGDSVAGGLGRMFETLAPDSAVEIRSFPFPGCSPMRAKRVRLPKGTIIAGEICDEAIDYWRSHHAELQPDWVLLIDGLSGLEREIEGAWHHPCEPIYDRKLTRDLVAFFRSLEGSTAVIVKMPPPEVVKTRPGEDREALQLLARERMGCQNAARELAATRLGAPVLDLYTRVCPGGVCGEPSRALRPDGIHYYEPEGLPIARWFVEKLEALAAEAR